MIFSLWQPAGNIAIVHYVVIWVSHIHLISLLILVIIFKLACGCNQCCQSFGPVDCQEWYELGHTKSGVYHVTPCGTHFGYDVYCDMETDGGGWLVNFEV